MQTISEANIFNKIQTQSAHLVLEDGSVFRGTAIGAKGETSGEVVFNTALTGYQEIMTDPSYAGQIVTLTYPHIGNVGTNAQDEESAKVWIKGLIIRDLSLCASNWRSEESLQDYLTRHNITAITGIDTRRLTRILRDKGAQRGMIVTAESIEPEQLTRQAQAIPSLNGQDLAKVVTCEQSYEWREGSWYFPGKFKTYADNQLLNHVVVYDFGVKRNILRCLVDQGCYLTVVPATTPASEILALQPDGVMLSNGPGDPAACDYAIENTKQLIQANIPLFGICLGFQILMLALGADTYKMKFGHHGANHPVQDLNTKQVSITSQNHGFAVAEDSLPANIQVTHRSLFDKSLQGVCGRDKPLLGFQGHPEASPGPHDINDLFARFAEYFSL